MNQQKEYIEQIAYQILSFDRDCVLNGDLFTAIMYAHMAPQWIELAFPKEIDEQGRIVHFSIPFEAFLEEVWEKFHKNPDLLDRRINKAEQMGFYE